MNEFNQKCENSHAKLYDFETEPYKEFYLRFCQEAC